MSILSLAPDNPRTPADDVDIESFKAEMRNKMSIQLVDAITDAGVSLDFGAASSIYVVVEDDEKRTIENSGIIARKVDVNVDGVWWTLVSCEKQGRSLTLTFEDRSINVLRYYNKVIMANRANVTRRQFIKRMLDEPKEIKIEYVIPELDTVQPVSDVGPNQILVNAQGSPLVSPPTPVKGVSDAAKLTVKGAPANAQQIANANAILRQGISMGASRKVLVASIDTAITESQITNLLGGDRDSVGVFQQRKSQGWPATRDIPTDAAAFFQLAIKIDQSNPAISIPMLCQSVQHSAFSDGSNYASWTSEADAFVTAFGLPPSVDPSALAAAPNGGSIGNNNQVTDQQILSAAQSGTFFMRGQIAQKNSSYILTKEDSWTCISRLSSEENIEAFAVRGVIYIASTHYIFEGNSVMTISEDTPGIDTIDYDLDEGKKQATVTVKAHTRRWVAPPGTLITIEKHAPVDGKWIVDSYKRSFYDNIATIELIKARPLLPEPTVLATLPAGFTGPQQPPGGARNAGPTTNPNVLAQGVIAYAQSQLGVPYKWGSELPGVAFDCSGLTQAAYNSVGISIPRTAQSQYDAGPKVPSPGILLPGDLVYFGNPSDPGGLHHVAIYIGDGAIIHAPHSGDVVRIQDNFLNAFDDYYGATRPWQR